MIARRSAAMIARRSMVLGSAALAASCGGPPPPPPPPTLELTIACAAVINPDDAGAAAPVAVRVYLLSAETRFQRADVFALTEREKATLGGDGGAVEEVVVRPNDKRVMKPALGPESRYLGIAVLFRDIDRAQWRTVAPLASSGPNRLTLKIEGTTATLAPP